MSIRNVITRLGGISFVARALGHRNASTVQGWWEREVIPAHNQRAVLNLAARLGVGIDAECVIPPLMSAPHRAPQRPPQRGPQRAPHRTPHRAAR